jgi:hypothetical protein
MNRNELSFENEVQNETVVNENLENAGGLEL